MSGDKGKRDKIMKKFLKIRYVNKIKKGEGKLHVTSTFGNPIEFS